MRETSQTIQVDTSLGSLRIEVMLTGNHLSQDGLELESREVQTEHPSGMSVERCRAFLVRVIAPDAPFQVRFRATLSSDAIGHPCTGEGLEAQEWENAGSLLVVGTEHAEALKARMPGLDIAPDQVIASYSPQGIEVNVSAKAQATSSTFHFIIAENASTKPAPDSAWFAVDMAHKSVMK